MKWASVSFCGLLVLTLMLAMAIDTTNGQYGRKNLMVVDFDAQATGWGQAREVVTTRIITKLREDGTWRVLPRDRVQAALQEAKVESMGFLDPEDLQQVAKALEADYVVMGVVETFDQKQSGGCLPIIGCLYTLTATVGLRGKVLDAPTASVMGEPKASVSKTQTGASIVGIGPVRVPITLGNLDQQLIGKVAQEAIDQFVADLKRFLPK